MTPWQKYQQDLTQDDFHYDPHQEQAVQHLQRLYNALQKQELTRKSVDQGWLSRLRQRFKSEPQEPILGLYLWGGVGRGKTYLIDSFYLNLPGERKL